MRIFRGFGTRCLALLLPAYLFLSVTALATDPVPPPRNPILDANHLVLAGQFDAVAACESIGGNAGNSSFAVNFVYHRDTGRIIVLGNYQYLSATVHAGLNAGVYLQGTVIQNAQTGAIEILLSNRTPRPTASIVTQSIIEFTAPRPPMAAPSPPAPATAPAPAPAPDKMAIRIPGRMFLTRLCANPGAQLAFFACVQPLANELAQWCLEQLGNGQRSPEALAANELLLNQILTNLYGNQAGEILNIAEAIVNPPRPANCDEYAYSQLSDGMKYYYGIRNSQITSPEDDVNIREAKNDYARFYALCVENNLAAPAPAPAPAPVPTTPPTHPFQAIDTCINEWFNPAVDRRLEQFQSMVAHTAFWNADHAQCSSEITARCARLRDSLPNLVDPEKTSAQHLFNQYCRQLLTLN